MALFTTSYLFANLLALPATWQGMAAYIRSFSVVQMLWMLPAFGLALVFVVVVACIHQYASEDKKLYS